MRLEPQIVEKGQKVTQIIRSRSFWSSPTRPFELLSQCPCVSFLQDLAEACHSAKFA